MVAEPRHPSFPTDAQIAEFRGQIENTLGALGAWIEEVVRAVADASAQHMDLHTHVGTHTVNITQIAKDLAVRKKTTDDLAAAPQTSASEGGFEKRKRLDRMVEIRGNLQLRWKDHGRRHARVGR